MPFTSQVKKGKAPLCCVVAAYVTWVPAQIGLSEAIMETETGTMGMMVINTTFDVSGTLQSGMQLTRAIRRNQLVWDTVSKESVGALLDGISVKPMVEFVVDDCHLTASKWCHLCFCCQWSSGLFE